MATLSATDIRRLNELQRRPDGSIFDPVANATLSANHRLATAFNEMEQRQQAEQERFFQRQAGQEAQEQREQARREQAAGQRTAQQEQQAEQARQSLLSARQVQASLVEDAESLLTPEQMDNPELYQQEMGRILGRNPQYQAVVQEIELAQQALRGLGATIGPEAIQSLAPPPRASEADTADFVGGEPPGEPPVQRFQPLPDNRMDAAPVEAGGITPEQMMFLLGGQMQRELANQPPGERLGPAVAIPGRGLQPTERGGPAAFPSLPVMEAMAEQGSDAAARAAMSAGPATGGAATWFFRTRRANMSAKERTAPAWPSQPRRRRLPIPSFGGGIFNRRRNSGRRKRRGGREWLGLKPARGHNNRGVMPWLTPAA